MATDLAPSLLAVPIAGAGLVVGNDAFRRLTPPGTLRAGELFEVIHGPREVGIVELFRSRAALRKQG